MNVRRIHRKQQGCLEVIASEAKQSRCATPRNQAFTLLEMLVAMLILATIITTVYSAFHAGILASRRVMRQDNSLQTILGRLNLMTSEIRNAVYWNDVLIAGSAGEIYFYVPMQLKNPADVLPLYRVRYWLDTTGRDSGTLYRSVAPCIALQRPGLTPEEIPRLETTQAWLGPLQKFQMEFAMSKQQRSVTVLGEDAQPKTDGTPVEGNAELLWKTSFAAKTEVPYGIRMTWEDQGNKKACLLAWPALGLFQTKPSLLNVAPTSGVVSTPDQLSRQ